MKRTPSIWLFSVLSASLAAGYGVLFTLVGDFRDAYGISESAIGLVIGVGFLAGFVSQVLLAPLADRGHARRVIIIGGLSSIIGLLLMGFGQSFTPILIGRLVSGLGAGAASPSIRRIVVLADPTNIGRNLGRILAAGVFGYGIGPAISALTAEPIGLAAPFVIVAAAVAVSLALAWRVQVVETVAQEPRRLALDLLRSRLVAGAVVLGAGGYGMVGAFDALWDIVHEDLGTATWMANLGITVFAIPMVLLSSTGGRLAERYGPFRTGAVGLILAGCLMFTYGQLPNGQSIIAVSMIHSVVDGLTFVAAGVAIGTVVPAHRQAGAQGLLGAAQALGAGFMAILVATVHDGHGRAVAYATSAAIIIGFALVGLLLGLPYIRDNRGRRQTAPAAT